MSASFSKFIHELDFCLELREKEGGCSFGGGTKCDQCAVPYLLLKLLTGKILHGNVQRLTKEDWKRERKNILSQ